jgi:two-component system response regulator HydG
MNSIHSFINRRNEDLMLFSDFSGKIKSRLNKNVLGFSSEVMAIFQNIDGLEILGTSKLY